FTAVGLLHIVVLSGYNVMIVAEAILRGLQFAPKRIAIGIASITILLFVLAAGGGASAVRAGIMAGVGLFARATSRTYDALRALVFVLVLMLLLNPLLLIYDPGFQFSFMATLGLIIGAPRVEPYLVWVKSNMLREVLATTIAAQVFVLPLLLYETENLSLVAVPANVLVLPVIPLTMLLSFIAGLVGIVLPAIAVFVGLPAFALLSYIIGVATFTAGLPLAAVMVPSFPFVLVLALYALLGFGIKHTTARQRGAP
ncbi:MAG: ComEC/Rec2 family competence protein, partial [Patescibacteria group bacterium]